MKRVMYTYYVGLSVFLIFIIVLFVFEIKILDGEELHRIFAVSYIVALLSVFFLVGVLLPQITLSEINNFKFGWFILTSVIILVVFVSLCSFIIFQSPALLFLGFL